MADIGNSIGGLLQGFNSVYWPSMRANETEARAQQELALRKAQDDRAAAMQDFQMRKYAEAEAKDQQASGLYAGMLGIKPTTPDDAKINEMDATAPETIWKNGGNSNEYVDALTKANPQYEQFMEGGAKAGADMVKQTREGELAKLKMQSDAWKEQNAARLADLKDRQIMAMIAKGQGGSAGKTAQERITDLIVDVDMARAAGRPVDPKMAAMADMYRDSPTFNPGGALTKGARSALQKGQDDAEEVKSGMKQVLSMHKDDYSTTLGSAVADYENFANRKFGQPLSETSKGRDTWKAMVDQNFQAYRKWATGVAASQKELDRLEATYPNSSDGPDQFRAKMKAVELVMDEKMKQKGQALGASRRTADDAAPAAQPTKRIRVDINGNTL